jgi:hypothetical protein
MDILLSCKYFPMCVDDFRILNGLMTYDYCETLSYKLNSFFFIIHNITETLFKILHSHWSLFSFAAQGEKKIVHKSSGHSVRSY